MTLDDFIPSDHITTFTYECQGCDVVFTMVGTPSLCPSCGDDYITGCVTAEYNIVRV